MKINCKYCKVEFQLDNEKSTRQYCSDNCKYKCRSENTKKTLLDRYGVDHPSKLSSTKEKIKIKRESGAYSDVPDKMKLTLLEKYGKENYVNVDKAKKTKLLKYGDENFNNREKMKRTLESKYGENHPLIEITKQRASSGEIGFGSEKFKKFLLDNNITNTSQLESVRRKKSLGKIESARNEIFYGKRLGDLVLPTFKEEEYVGSDYDKMYGFRCVKCETEFSDNLYSGNIPRCPKCFPVRTSTEQLEILEFIRTFDVEANDNVKIPNSNLEIDVYSEKFKIGVEMNGIYWHGETKGKDKEYHISKLNKCNESGIRLLQFTDHEWNYKNDIVKNIISLQFQKGHSVYARKCIVKEINKEQKSEFLDRTHIQGDDNSNVYLGLFYMNKLMSVMTFCIPRYNKMYEYEISRFSNEFGIRIIGGAAKLFSNFIKIYNPRSIITYSEKRIFTGSVYEHIGMKKLSDTSPNYFYFKPPSIKLMSRLQFQKHKIKSKLPIFDKDKTEWENMKANGYDRIWDCGNHKFEWISEKIKKN